MLCLFKVMEEKVLQKVLKVGEGDDFVKRLRKAVNSGSRGNAKRFTEKQMHRMLKLVRRAWRMRGG